MSDDENVPSFLEDDIVKFIGENVCRLLRLQRETWEKSAVTQEFQTVLKDFFEKQSILFLTSTSDGSLIASKEVSSSPFLLLNLQCIFFLGNHSPHMHANVTNRLLAKITCN